MQNKHTSAVAKVFKFFSKWKYELLDWCPSAPFFLIDWTKEIFASTENFGNDVNVIYENAFKWMVFSLKFHKNEMIRD